MALVPIASSISILLYLASAGLLIRRFFGHSGQKASIPLGILSVAIIAHFSVVAFALWQVENEKLSLGFVLLVIAWLISFSMFVANKFIKNLVFLPIVSISACIFILLHLFMPAQTGIDSQMKPGLLLHISLSMLAFGFLGIAALYTLQLSYINYQLKHKKRSLLKEDLPPLLSVEHISFKLMAIGSGILFCALASGFIFVPDMFADGYAHKTVLSTMAFLVFIVGLIYQHFRGIRVKSAIWINAIGLVLLALSYFGSRVVQEVILS